MSKRSTTCLRCSRAAGLTLIEVVAAIAILGTILVGIVLAQSRNTRQLAEARRTAEAVRHADELLADWWADEQGVPLNAAGAIDADPTLAWRTRRVANPPIEQLGGRVVRVEVLDTAPALPGAEVTGRDRTLVTVDLIVPDPRIEQREAEALRRLLEGLP